MKLSVKIVLLTVVFVPLWANPAAAQVDEDSLYIRQHYTKIERRVPMRDGARLFTSIYVPKDSSQAYPILMQRMPYSSTASRRTTEGWAFGDLRAGILRDAPGVLLARTPVAPQGAGAGVGSARFPAFLDQPVAGYHRTGSPRTSTWMNGPRCGVGS